MRRANRCNRRVWLTSKDDQGARRLAVGAAVGGVAATMADGDTGMLATTVGTAVGAGGEAVGIRGGPSDSSALPISVLRRVLRSRLWVWIWTGLRLRILNGRKSKYHPITLDKIQTRLVFQILEPNGAV
jgi:hypothetical protein